MAKVQIDLEKSYISCTACGKGTADGIFPSPCPYCGVEFTRVEYKREKVRVSGTTYGRKLFTLGDVELEKRKAVDYVWETQQLPGWVSAGYQPESIRQKKKEFYATRLIDISDELASAEGLGQDHARSPEKETEQ